MPDNIEYSLDDELLNLEAELTALVPSAMPEEFVSRMDAMFDHPMIDAAVDMHDAELKNLEEHLELLSPAGMSSDVLTRMTEAMERWHEHIPLEEKLVPFGQVADPESISQKRSKKTNHVNMYGAAAAVAMLGVVAALVAPNFSKGKTSPVVSTSVENFDQSGNPNLAGISTPSDLKTVEVSNAPRDAWLVPGSLTHDVTDTSDAGVLMTSDNIPHRSIRIDYIDRIKVLDEDGREIEINRPGVQYMLIPVQTN